MRRAAAAEFADRLCRPQRVGVFGHRGVGKTTLLTMLYSESVHGRLPDLRLAAADARTANYLSDKMLQLESGQPVPATLAETELRLQLYHCQTRLELLLKDYQGEHIELGRTEPIRDFLRDCDAVLLCLDLGTVPDSARRLARQQEVEQLIEDYLAIEPGRKMERPIALVLTKADLLDPLPADLDTVALQHFGMTRHAVQSHCPRNGLFAVSCRTAPPSGLAEPLAWLTTALHAQDEARLERLWSEGGHDVALLTRCVRCFTHRYPDSPASEHFQQRLRQLRRSRRQRRGLVGAAVAASLLAALWTYDALGYREAAHFETEHAEDPSAVLQNWQQYRGWHPSGGLWQPSSAQGSDEHLRDLAQRAREQQRSLRLAELRRQAVDSGADIDLLWQDCQEFRATYPEAAAELEPLRVALKARRAERILQRARRDCDELLRAAQRSSNLGELVTQADRFLRDYPGSPFEEQVRTCRTAALQRLDEQDIQAARDYSTAHPFNFQTRTERYQAYLGRHPDGGAFTKEAQDALRTIAGDWDKLDFRGVRDHFLAHPGEIPEVVARCRRYLAVHPRGRFTTAAADLLRWTERVTAPGEYRVTLVNGEFDNSVARFFSRGPKLSVALEINGIRHGPSTIVYNRYDPEWNFEFPRLVRWKLGDPVRVIVTEHSWADRVVVDVTSAGNDPLAMRMLMGDVSSGSHRLTFETNFTMPKLPKVE